MLEEPRLRTLPEQPVAIQRRSTTPDGVSAALQEILPAVFAHLAEAGVAPAGAPFSRYPRVTDTEVELEAGLPVAAPYAGDGAVEADRLPGGETLVVRHIGDYDTVHTAHEAAAAWCEQHGRRAGGPAWESYLTDPGTEPDPARWVTEVYVPLS